MRHRCRPPTLIASRRPARSLHLCPPADPKPTPTHYFLKLLHDKGVLQRVWSQNIDTLETAAGVPADLVVEAHGSFREAHCLDCRRSASTEYVLKAGVRNGAVVRCEQCDGLVKPDIVFFGEGLPDNFFMLMVSVPAKGTMIARNVFEFKLTSGGTPQSRPCTRDRHFAPGAPVRRARRPSVLLHPATPDQPRGRWPLCAYETW